jgi:hypothetical protein
MQELVEALNLNVRAPHLKGLALFKVGETMHNRLSQTNDLGLSARRVLGV